MSQFVLPRSGRKPLVWSSTALGASTSEPGRGLRMSRLRRLLHDATTRRIVQWAGDAAAAISAVMGALWSWSAIDGYPLTLQYVRSHAAWFALGAVWLLLLQWPFISRPPTPTRDTAAIVARAVVAGIGIYLVLYFLAPRDLLPRLVVLNFLAFVSVATLVWRVVDGHLFADDTREIPVAVIGEGAAARDIAALLRVLAPHKRVLGLFPGQKPDAAAQPGASAADLRALVAGRGVTALILAADDPIDPDVLRTIVRAQEHGIDVVPMHAVYEQVLRRLPIRHTEPARILESLAEARRRVPAASRCLKRTFDIAGAGAGCALLLLLLPVLGPLAWLDVGWPVVYRQERLGLAGRRFRLLKLRTMASDAERDGPRWAEADDSRASRFGRFLRRYHLDEFPQFWNVLRGEMSLVGPRPERPEFVDDLDRRIPCYRERLLVRPGLSGWAQVNYPYGASVDGSLDKLEYDLYYIKHQSLWFDAVIVWRTIWTVLAHGGR